MRTPGGGGGGGGGGVEVEQETSAPPPKKNPGSKRRVHPLLKKSWIRPCKTRLQLSICAYSQKTLSAVLPATNVLGHNSRYNPYESIKKRASFSRVIYEKPNKLLKLRNEGPSN